MWTKEEVAAKLAQAHYHIEPGMHQIIRLIGPEEAVGDEPIKLLEINDETVEGGIVPVYFGPQPHSGITYSSVIISITPDEYERLKAGKLVLPDGWRFGQPYERPVAVASLAA